MRCIDYPWRRSVAQIMPEQLVKYLCLQSQKAPRLPCWLECPVYLSPFENSLNVNPYGVHAQALYCFHRTSKMRRRAAKSFWVGCLSPSHVMAGDHRSVLFCSLIMVCLLVKWSQVESFEAGLEVEGLRNPEQPFAGVFIRAPVRLAPFASEKFVELNLPKSPHRSS